MHPPVFPLGLPSCPLLTNLFFCRFSQIERSRSNNNIGASSGNALRGGSGKVKKSRRGRHGGPTPMDIDRPTRSAPPSNNAGGDRPARKGYNGPNRRGDRGGKPKTPSRETLDMDLDNYMLKDTKVAKAVLDNELDAYMTQS